MFELKLKKVTVVFDFSFFATVSLLILLKSGAYAIIGISACLWHEFGHLAAMQMCSVPVKKIVFYGAGIKIIPDKLIDFTDYRSSMLIYLAGSALNLISSLALSFSSMPELRLFASFNAVIGAFNLLPLQYWDGGKIILLIIQKLCSFQRACILERYLKWINMILIFIVLIAFSFTGRGNITLYITLCYLLVSSALY